MQVRGPSLRGHGSKATTTASIPSKIPSRSVTKMSAWPGSQDTDRLPLQRARLHGSIQNLGSTPSADSDHGESDELEVFEDMPEDELDLGRCILQVAGTERALGTEMRKDPGGMLLCPK